MVPRSVRPGCLRALILLLSLLEIGGSAAGGSCKQCASGDRGCCSQKHGRSSRALITLPQRPRLCAVPNSVRHVLAGACSGALGVTALAPVEIVRINMLANRDWSLRTAVASLSSGWFRGNTADVIAAAMRVGITMPAFAFYKDLLTRNDEPPSGSQVFLAGALAGCTATVVCFPLEVARTRLAVACDLRFGLLGCFVAIVSEARAR